DNFPPREMLARARDAAGKAISLDEGVAEPHAVLGVVKAAADYDWRGCGEEFRGALQVGPNFAIGPHSEGSMRVYRGRDAEASDEFHIASQLDPLNPAITAGFANALAHAGRYNEALSLLRKLRERDSRSFYALMVMGQVYDQMGRYTDAIPLLREAL